MSEYDHDEYGVNGYPFGYQCGRFSAMYGEHGPKDGRDIDGEDRDDLFGGEALLAEIILHAQELPPHPAGVDIRVEQIAVQFMHGVRDGYLANDPDANDTDAWRVAAEVCNNLLGECWAHLAGLTPTEA